MPLVDRVNTPWTDGELEAAYRAAWRAVCGGEASDAAVALLCGQAILECKWGGAACWNWNTGNVMLGASSGDYYVSRAPECFPANAVPAGWTVVTSAVACGPGKVAAVSATGSKFRAYPSLLDGCIDKLKRLLDQWPDAIMALQVAVSVDDAFAFVKGLYPGPGRNYATASQDSYCASVRDIAGTFLKRIAAARAPKVKMIEAHLPTVAAPRTNTSARAYRLNEATMPAHDGTPESTLRIVEWLGVERNGRWDPRIPGGSTYCNVLAHDLCGLLGAFVPRVWWNETALAEIRAGRTPTARYAATVREMSANDLCRWLVKYGADFGWRRVDTLDEAQDAANDGCAVVISARRTEEAKSGHISVVIPESSRCHAKRDAAGRVVLPVQCQAGATNIEMGYLPTAWWRGPEMAEHVLMVHREVRDTDPAPAPDLESTWPDSPKGKSSQSLRAVNVPIVDWSPQTSAHTVLPDIVPLAPDAEDD